MFKNLNIEEEFKELMLILLQENEQYRATMADLIYHPWMRGETATHEQYTRIFKLFQRKAEVKHNKDLIE